jgi:hypothetical protein
MFAFSRLVLVLSLSLSANADTVRGAQRKLDTEPTVGLGTADQYAVLSKTAISTVPTSDITGDIAVSPAAATFMTGFAFTPVTGKASMASTQITGEATGANMGGSIASTLTTAVSDMMTAYTDAAGRTNTNKARINLKGGEIGGETLTAGVYTFSTSVLLTGDITFEGTSTDIFIIQIAGNLVQSANYNVILKDGPLAKNIFWQVAGTVTVGAGAHMEGVILGATTVTFITGSSLDGRILAQTAVALQMATITPPAI